MGTAHRNATKRNETLYIIEKHIHKTEIMNAKFTIIDTNDFIQEDTIKTTESVARGLADGYAFNFLEYLKNHLHVEKKITILLPKIKGNDAANSWVQNGNATIADLISTMKQDGPGKLLNDKEVSLHQNGMGRPMVNTLHKGGALIDIPTTLSVAIRGIGESCEGDFDMKRYNSEIDIFGNRLAMRIREVCYMDIVRIVKGEFLIPRKLMGMERRAIYRLIWMS